MTDSTKMISTTKTKKTRKIPDPIRIWLIADAPKRYRELFEDARKNSPEDYEGYRWVAVLRSPEAVKGFWPKFVDPAPAGCLARNLSAGVLFERVDLDEEVVYFFTDNDPD